MHTIVMNYHKRTDKNTGDKPQNITVVLKICMKNFALKNSLL